MGQTFEELIGQHLDDMYSAALCFTLDERRAEELLQEASIRAFHELPVDRTASFRLAMLGILVSTHLQREHRAGRDPFAVDAPPIDELLEAGGPRIEPFPERGTPTYELLIRWIGRVWAELDAGDRLVLWLADVERVRHEPIARLLALGPDEVRSRHYRARLALSRGAMDQLSQAV
jgi:DNA-directed RNA polymerase specialized sigma24 family protein